ncbi:YqcI/YcgG family protein [Streptomyces sp. CA2R106]|uniref:YqcI/YcgG family protein n=1 Tax=Streptomyces sp. CA2R106 TaxID=3120153 RepID=UPI00300A4908
MPSPVPDAPSSRLPSDGPSPGAPAGSGSASPRPAAPGVRTLGDVPDWGPAAASDLLATLVGTEQPFPCTFAVAAAKKESLRFGFVGSAHDPAAWAPLAGILREYLDIYRDLGKDTSLVVFFGPPEEHPLGLAEYFHRFWAVLQHLHDGDTEPWPAGTPLDPEDLWWEFSFAGTEIFVVCNTPAHVDRHSRHSPHFMITFQPRWVFEGLEPHTPRGARARQVIRNRIRRFDGMEPAPQLGNHGEEGNREWRQYFLPDSPEGSTPSCPFLARAGAREPAATGGSHLVLVNDEGQSSLWPAAVPVPPHWHPTGVRGSREACLAYVVRVWTDMRPASSRRRDLDPVG